MLFAAHHAAAPYSPPQVVSLIEWNQICMSQSKLVIKLLYKFLNYRNAVLAYWLDVLQVWLMSHAHKQQLHTNHQPPTMVWIITTIIDFLFQNNETFLVAPYFDENFPFSLFSSSSFISSSLKLHSTGIGSSLPKILTEQKLH